MQDILSVIKTLDFEKKNLVYETDNKLLYIISLTGFLKVCKKHQ